MDRASNPGRVILPALLAFNLSWTDFNHAALAQHAPSARDDPLEREIESLEAYGLQVRDAAKRIMTDLFELDDWDDEHQLRMTLDGPLFDNPDTYLEQGTFAPPNAPAERFTIQAYAVVEDAQFEGKMLHQAGHGTDGEDQIDWWMGKLWVSGSAAEYPAAGFVFWTDAGYHLLITTTWGEYHHGLGFLDGLFTHYRSVVGSREKCEVRDAEYDSCVRDALREFAFCRQRIHNRGAVLGLSGEVATALTCGGCMATFNPIVCTACLGALAYWGRAGANWLRQLMDSYTAIERAVQCCCDQAHDRQNGVQYDPNDCDYKCPLPQ